MYSYYYNHVGCINHKSLLLIETNLTEILDKEGFKRVSNITEDLFTKEIAYSYDLLTKLIRNFLIIGLFPGNYGWTFIKTLPREFLCRRGNNSTQPRLAMLTTKINCQAFHWSVYRDYFGILLEANEQGKIHVSGSYPKEGTECDLEKNLFYQEKIDYDSEWKFHLIEMPEDIKEAMRPETKEELKAIQAKLYELEKLFELGVNTQFEEEELLRGSGTLADRALRRYFGNSSEYWRRHFCLAYSEKEEIEANGGKLLYFKTPEYYQHIKEIAYIEGKY
jgi:hypothetical protein